jgi:branched-chain amino acid transport system substrate-binding protein
MKKLGIKARLLMGDGGCTTEFIKNAAAAAEGHYCSLPGIPYDKMPGGPEFIERFKAKYGDIQLYAPYAYDAVMVVVDAIKRAGSAESARILAELPKTSYKGVTTTITFDDKGDIKDGAISLYVAKGGKWEAMDTIGGPPPAPAPAEPVAGMGGMSGMSGMAAPAAAAPAAAPAAPADPARK